MTSNAHVYVEGTDIEFILGSSLSSGGQGEVFRVVNHPNYAIKILKRSEDLSRISFVSRLDLVEFSVAPPLATVSGDSGVGYLMNLAEDMETLSDTCIRPWNYLDSSVDLSVGEKDFYRRTGGLKRRLGLSANLASTLSALHGQALVYVDLNPGNVMVSTDNDSNVLWLIDTDNLTYISKVDQALYTPGYRAPELGRTGPTTLSDAHSLAILVFQLLVMTHPFSGMASSQMDAREWQAAVIASRLPYVDDAHIDTNRLPTQRQDFLETVLSNELRKLARQAFTEGLFDPTARPGVRRWRDVLFGALDNVVTCSASCGWSFYRTSTAPYVCPECGEISPTSTLLLVYPPDTELTHAYRTLVIDNDTKNDLLPRHLWGNYDDSNPVLSIKYDGGVFHVEEHGDVTITDKKTGKKLSQATSHKGGEGRELLVQSSNQPDRVIKFMDVTLR